MGGERTYEIQKARGLAMEVLWPKWLLKDSKCFRLWYAWTGYCSMW